MVSPFRFRLATIVLGALVLTGCVGQSWRDPDIPIAAQADVDFTRYTGLWYEIARYPVRFQRGCTGTKASYGALPEDRISVVNTCFRDGPDGPLSRIEGSANIVGPGKLRVRFSGIPFVAAPYWVLWVDDSYETAVVGVPSGQSGWILARTPEIPDARMKRAQAVLRANGYDPSAMIAGQ
jgi:apolipoprotein D and lipocalin family protein